VRCIRSSRAVLRFLRPDGRHAWPERAHSALLNGRPSVAGASQKEVGNKCLMKRTFWTKVAAFATRCRAFVNGEYAAGSAHLPLISSRHRYLHSHKIGRLQRRRARPIACFNNDPRGKAVIAASNPFYLLRKGLVEMGSNGEERPLHLPFIAAGAILRRNGPRETNGGYGSDSGEN
jgi:hypothetical protein